MKKNLLLILSVFIVSFTQAQPIIDSSNFTPLNNEKVYRSICNYMSPFTSIATGTNASWDFTGLITASTDSFIYVHPDSTGLVPNNCFQYPCFVSPTEANISIPHSNGARMFRYTASGMIERGWCNGSNTMGCTETMRFPFPITYNDSSLNVFYGSGFDYSITPGLTWTDSTIYKLNAVGYGSLLLPNATYNGTLLVKVIQVRTETDFMFCPGGCTSIDTIYYWLVPNIQHPVLQINYPVGLNNNDFYVSQIVLDAKEIFVSKQQSVFPNPFHSTTTLQLTNDFANSKLTIYNTIGEEVRELKLISGTILINREGLKDGFYFYRVTNGKGETVHGNFIVE